MTHTVKNWKPTRMRMSGCNKATVRNNRNKCIHLIVLLFVHGEGSQAHYQHNGGRRSTCHQRHTTTERCHQAQNRDCSTDRNERLLLEFVQYLLAGRHFRLQQPKFFLACSELFFPGVCFVAFGLGRLGSSTLLGTRLRLLPQLFACALRAILAIFATCCALCFVRDKSKESHATKPNSAPDWIAK